jgi:hypothetical protein
MPPGSSVDRPLNDKLQEFRVDIVLRQLEQEGYVCSRSDVTDVLGKEQSLNAAYDAILRMPSNWLIRLKRWLRRLEAPWP